MASSVFSTLKSFRSKLFGPVTDSINRLRVQVEPSLKDLHDLILLESNHRAAHDHPNPFNRFGLKVFSQADEDGITLEIVRRLGIQNGAFAEFGVGNGTENNTIVLAALNWSGFWVGAEKLAINVPESNSFAFLSEWIDRNNVVNIAKRGMKKINAGNLDLISLDLDGNDFFLVQELLTAGIHPKIFIVEYNAKFPPPIKFTVEYDQNHQWHADDYMGASLAIFAELFEQHGYRLICCNSATGANAFFVRSDFGALFPEVPTEIDKLYSPMRYYVLAKHGHRISPRTIENILAGRIAQH